ncbi:MAG TPA: response regulator [Pyrinomonadaceae bacterium]|jgi:CheY-like chemotaxis protein
MFAVATDENKQMSNISSSSFVPRQTSDLPPTVLIVEDDEDNRLMLKIMLEMWKYRVIEAENGEEAVDSARANCPDLILMDLKMQLLSGLEATRQIRGSAEIGGVPIIFVSGCAEAGFRRAALDAGGNEYLVKPIMFEHLENVLAEYIGNRHATETTGYSDGN